MSTETTEPTDRKSFAPLVFLAYDSALGRYGLILSDDHMVSTTAAFGERGHEGGGYDWEAVARSAIRSRAPELAGRLAYDCEAGMFAAHGTDADALRRLGALLSEAHRDPAVLAAYLVGGGPGLVRLTRWRRPGAGAPPAGPVRRRSSRAWRAPLGCPRAAW